MAPVAANDSGYAFLLKQHMADVRQRLAAKGEPVATRIERELIDTLGALEDKRRHITSGGGRVGPYQKEQLVAEHRRLKTHLHDFKKQTIENLQGQEAARRAAAARPAVPDDAIARELRLARLERRADRLRALDPLKLLTRLEPSAPSVTDDLEALEFAAATGFPIEHPGHAEQLQGRIEETRRALAEAGSPQIAELAHIRRSYEYALSISERVAREWATSDGVDLWDPSDIRTTDGQPFPAGAAK